MCRVCKFWYDVFLNFNSNILYFLYYKITCSHSHGLKFIDPSTCMWKIIKTLLAIELNYFGSNKFMNVLVIHAVYEIFERMAYYGISSNLILYLTTKLHQGVVSSSNNVTNWAGTIWITPILGAYIADAKLGRYWTFVIASVVYLLVCLYFCHIWKEKKKSQ